MLFTGKNNREYESPILIIRDELGIKMKDLVAAVGCSHDTIYSLAYGVSWPVYRDGKLKPYVEKLSDVLGTPVEELFPMFFCKLKPQTVDTDDVGISDYTLRISQDSEDLALLRERYEKVVGLMRLVLDKRRFTVMLMYFIDDMTYAEIGEHYKISRDRVGILLKSAISKLQHAIKCRQLSEALA